MQATHDKLLLLHHNPPLCNFCRWTELCFTSKWFWLMGVGFALILPHKARQEIL